MDQAEEITTLSNTLTGLYRIASRPKECKKDCDIHYAGLETAFSNCSNGFRFRNVFEPLLAAKLAIPLETAMDAMVG